MAKSSKPGPKSVDPASRGSSPSGVSAGSPGKSMPAKPLPGPAGKGLPTSMKKALAKKPAKGGNMTGFAGLVR